MKITAPSTATENVVASVAGSTCAQSYPWLPELVARALRAREGRALSGAKGASARSDRVRGRCRVAWGARPLHSVDGEPLPMGDLLERLRGLMTARGYHADPRTMRDELRVLQQEEWDRMHSGTAMLPVQQQSIYRSIQSSTDGAKT